MRLDLAPGQPFCVQPDDTVVVIFSMADLPEPVTGYQAFLQFDPSALSFISGSYALPDPFGLPLVSPITASEGEISLAAGVNFLMGQSPTDVDADLATLVFEANAVNINTLVGFRPGEPTTQFTTDSGFAILPALTATRLIAIAHTPRPGDFDGDCDVDLDDFTLFQACMTGPSIPYDPGDLPSGCVLLPDGEGIIPADFNRDGSVDLLDFAVFQRCYSGPGIPADPHCAE